MPVSDPDEKAEKISNKTKVRIKKNNELMLKKILRKICF